MNTIRSQDIKKILLVEDDDRDYLVLKIALKPFPYTVVRFPSAEDGLDYLVNEQVDIIISDYNLPGMTGLDFLQSLQQKHISVPTVLLTGAGSEVLAAAAIRSGVNEYAMKDVAGGYLDLLPLLIERAQRHFQTEQEIKFEHQQNALNALVIDNMIEGVAITDPDNFIIGVNKAFTDITGYSLDEVRGKHPSVLASGVHDPLFYEYMWDDLKEKRHWKGKIFNRRKNGEIYPEWLTISCICNPDNEIEHFVAIFSDISNQQVKSKELVSHYAYYDALTGLPNRLLFEERILNSISRAQRTKTRLALMALDLDRFKPVNDTYGHGVGDALLVEVGQRLQASTRETDTVVRISGDEFIVLLSDINDSLDATPVAEKIVQALNSEFIIQEHSIFISVSIGIAIYPDDNIDSVKLRCMADEALYRSKDAGRNQYIYYAEHTNQVNQECKQIAKQLQQAIDEQQFELHFQPIIDIETGHTKAVEALIRWRHPELGLILPVDFLSIAIKEDLIIPIGFWVVDKVISLLADPNLTAIFPRVSINLSVNEFSNDGLISHICQLIAQHNIQPGRLIIEISEKVLSINNKKEIDAKLTRLHAAGCYLWLDDFWQRPLDLDRLILNQYDAVKIDFYTLTESKDSDELTLTVLNIMQGLKIPVVHKHVESEKQSELLKQLNADWVQGYRFSYPLTLEQLKEKGIDHEYA